MSTTLEIRRSIVVSANRERVWRAITEPEQISTWFGHSITFNQLAVGEPITFFGQYHGTIAEVEPPERFAFYWPADENHPAMNLVTFVLESVHGGTRVTVTEQGFEALPDDLRQRRFDLNSEGWSIQMNNIAAYLQAEDHVQGR